MRNLIISILCILLLPQASHAYSCDEEIFTVEGALANYDVVFEGIVTRVTKVDTGLFQYGYGLENIHQSPKTQVEFLVLESFKNAKSRKITAYQTQTDWWHMPSYDVGSRRTFTLEQTESGHLTVSDACWRESERDPEAFRRYLQTVFEK